GGCRAGPGWVAAGGRGPPARARSRSRPGSTRGACPLPELGVAVGRGDREAEPLVELERGDVPGLDLHEGLVRAEPASLVDRAGHETTPEPATTRLGCDDEPRDARPHRAV